MSKEKNTEKTAADQPENLNQLLKVRREKLAALQEAGKDPFQITKFSQTHHTEQIKAIYTEHEEKLLAGRQAPSTEGLDPEAAKEVITADYNERRAIMDASPIEVSMAGRIMSKRVMGKASFCNVQDRDGNIQCYVARDEVGTDEYAILRSTT